uniref:Uncharacterized protein n=1 Tax=Musa acuminata subsp. malaccensis TaxID=214687 RepID=A0A804ICY2_MUSAM
MKAERLKRWDLSFCAFCSLVLVFIIFTIRSLGFTYRSSDSFFFFFRFRFYESSSDVLYVYELHRVYKFIDYRGEILI